MLRNENRRVWTIFTAILAAASLATENAFAQSRQLPLPNRSRTLADSPNATLATNPKATLGTKSNVTLATLPPDNSVQAIQPLDLVTGARESNIAPSLATPNSQYYIYQGPVKAKDPYYMWGGDKFHFSATMQYGNFTYNDIAAKAKSVASSEKSANSKSHVFDDLYYYWTLSTSGNSYLLLFWHDWTANRIEWAAVKNTPQYWYVMSSKSSTSTTLGTEQQYKVHFVVTSQNKSVDIDIYNPANTNGWTSNDIWYGFGY